LLTLLGSKPVPLAFVEFSCWLIHRLKDSLAIPSSSAIFGMEF
jgi:hypothetical protein